MSEERGMTLTELLIVVSVASLLLGATAAYSVPMIAKEAARGAVHDVQGYLQLARVEAVSRNRECRFDLDIASRRMSVTDTRGTAAAGDDEVLYRSRLPSTVSFTSPSGSAVTLGSSGTPGSSRYRVVFGSDGTVAQGAGQVTLYGATQFFRVSVFGAGGTEVVKWNGGGWTHL